MYYSPDVEARTAPGLGTSFVDRESRRSLIFDILLVIDLPGRPVPSDAQLFALIVKCEASTPLCSGSVIPLRRQGPAMANRLQSCSLSPVPPFASAACPADTDLR